MTPIHFIAEVENIASNRMKERYNIQYANTFLKRTLGLMFKKDFCGELVFTFGKPTNLFIHTLFMKFGVDVVCYNEKKELVKTAKLKPWRFMYVKNVKWFIEKKSV